MEVSLTRAFIPYDGLFFLSSEACLFDAKVLRRELDTLFPVAEDMGDGVAFLLNFPSGTCVRSLADAFAEGISLPELGADPLPVLEARRAHVLRLGLALHDAATSVVERVRILSSASSSLRFLSPEDNRNTVLYADDAERGYIRVLHGMVARHEVSWLDVAGLGNWLHAKANDARRFLGEIETEIRRVEQFQSALRILDRSIKVPNKFSALFSKKMDDFELGLRYYCGIGTAPDIAKAYERLSRYEDRLPITMLLQLPMFFPGSPREKVVWQHVAERGYAPIMLSLGEYYVHMHDWQRARECFEKAIERGEARARAKLAALIMVRRFRDTDYIAAAELVSGYENDLSPQQCMLMAEYLRFREHEAQSVHWLQQGAARGHLEAQYRLGECLLAGRGLARSIPKALDCWRKAGQGGHKRALFCLGECYWQGEVLERNAKLAENYLAKVPELVPGALARALAHEQPDKNKAFHWLKLAVDKGDPDAQFELAKHFEQMNDRVVCLSLLYKAAVQKHVAAMSLLARSILAQQDPQMSFGNDAFLWLHMAADKGDAEAQFYLGKSLLDGSKISKNEAGAIEWIQKAAAQNHVSALFQLGLCYDSGVGVGVDLTKAADSFKKAADGNHTEAAFDYAAMLESGRGVDKNRVKAAKYYRRAAEAGHSLAMEKMGDFAINGWGMRKNDREGVAWYEKAYAAKNLSAQKKLGLCLFYGETTPKDMQRAEELLHHTSDIAPEIQLGLGVFCQASPSRLADAVYWFELSAKQGYEEAQYLLALCLADGRGTAQDMARAEGMVRPFAMRLTGERQYLFGAWCQLHGLAEMAVFWYELAVLRMNGDAQFALALCLADGLGTVQNLARAERLATPHAKRLDAGHHFAFGAWCQEQSNTSKAVFWYEMAVKQNHADAQYALTLCLADGCGTQQNMARAEGMATTQAERYASDYQFRFGTWCLEHDQLEKAVFWFELAVIQNHVEAQYELALCLADGRGTKRDMKRAERMIRLFADRLTAEHQFKFASWCLKHNELENAVFWLVKAYVGGNTEARYELGICLYNGHGTTQDIKQAEKLLSATPERPPASVQYGLGEDCRKRGLYEKAVHWYEYSSGNNYPYAKEFFALSYRDGFEDMIKQDLKKSEQLFYEAAIGFRAANPNKHKEVRKSQKQVRRKIDQNRLRGKLLGLTLVGGILGVMYAYSSYSFGPQPEDMESFIVSYSLGIIKGTVAFLSAVWFCIRIYAYHQYAYGKYSL